MQSPYVINTPQEHAEFDDIYMKYVREAESKGEISKEEFEACLEKGTQDLRDMGYDSVVYSYGPLKEYIVFESEQAKLADAVTYDDSGDVIPLSKRFNTKKSDIRCSISGREISAGMSETERYEILKNKKIQPQKIEIDKDFDIEFSFLENNIKSIVEKTLIPKLQKLGYLKKYKSNAIDIEFEFTGKGLKKSIHSQTSDYGGNFGDFAKVVLNMQKLLDNSVLLEIHTDKGKGTPRENSRLVQTYVLLSAFKEGKSITPVQFEVKQYVDNDNRLYLAVALTKIEIGVMGNTAHQKDVRTDLLPISKMSIADLFKNVNIKDARFLKYAPDQFLNEEQIKAKEKALKEDEIKYSTENTIRYSISSEERKSILQQVADHEITPEEAEKLIQKEKPMATLKKIATTTADKLDGTNFKVKKRKQEIDANRKSKFAESLQSANILDQEFKQEVARDEFINTYPAKFNRDVLAKAFAKATFLPQFDKKKKKA